MPSEPVIVPPPPTITQPSHPGDDSPGLEQVQRAFDKVLPERKPSRAAGPETLPPKLPGTGPTPEKPESPSPDQPPPPPPPEPKPEPQPAAAKEERMPSFLEEALKLAPGDEKPPKPAEPSKPEVSEVETEWPEDLPQEQKQSRIKGLRDAYKRVKQEVETLRQRPSLDPQATQKLAYLEAQNKQMSEVLSRFGVEQSAEFQQQVIAPLMGAWNEAARIVHESGADPQELAKAMALQGRAQFEALDMLFSEMPESAKAEAHDALRAYRRYEDIRRHAVQNAPQALEGIRQRETERQYQELTRQREGMKTMFDQALSKLRDEAKVEIFQKVPDEQGKWWNDQGDRVVAQGRDLFLENTDLDKVAMACLLAPAADAYRNLFIKSQKKVAELQKIINDKFGNEPNLSESPGNAGNLMPDQQMQEDLKKPFADVFLREFHRSRERNR